QVFILCWFVVFFFFFFSSRRRHTRCLSDWSSDVCSSELIDDYAHHPTEIRATLGAAKAGNFHKIFAIFQPHRYSRTFHLFDDFARAFNLADAVLILDIYQAGEAPIEGITTPALIDKQKSFGHKTVQYARDFEIIESYIIANAQEG